MPATAGPKRQKRTPYDTTHLDGLDGAERFEAFAAALRYNGQPIVLKAWQLEALQGLYGARPRQAYIQVPRQRGKSFLVALAALYSLLADPLPTNPVVGLIANSERQARELFVKILAIAETTPGMDECLTIYNDRIEYFHGGARIQVFASSPAGAKGGGGRQIRGVSARLMIVDELAFSPDPDLWHSVLLPSIMADPHAMMLATTTPGYFAEGPAWDMYERWRNGDTDRFYAWIGEAPNEDPDDRDAWRVANGDPGDQFMADLEVARKSMPPLTFVREHMGRWTATASAWLETGLWDSLAYYKDYDPGERLWLGLDASFSGDSTALVGCNAQGHLKVLGLWENPGRKGWRVPVSEVDETVRHYMNLHPATRLHPDPYQLRALIEQWDRDYPERVIEFPTNAAARMVQAHNAFDRAVRTGIITHDGDEAFARHVRHAQVRTTSLGDRLEKASKDSKHKIDLAIAAELAFFSAELRAPDVELFVA